MQYKCSHCGIRKNETETVIASVKNSSGQIVRKTVCTKCIGRTLPNPLRKRVKQLWILVACLTAILSYLLAYQIF